MKKFEFTFLQYWPVFFRSFKVTEIIEYKWSSFYLAQASPPFTTHQNDISPFLGGPEARAEATNKNEAH